MIFILRFFKVSSFVKYENGGQGSELFKLPNEWDAGMKSTYFSLSNDPNETSRQFRRSTEATQAIFAVGIIILPLQRC